MTSFLNFTAFLKSHRSLKPHQLEALHKLLFQSPEPKTVHLPDLARTLELPVVATSKLADELDLAGVIKLSPIHCPACLREHSEISLYCENCGENLLSAVYFHINGCLSSSELEAFRQYRSRRVDAINYARDWINQGFSYYLLIDLVNSEKHQSADSDAYNRFFQHFREKLSDEILNEMRTPHLVLGEVGDCIKIAFIQPEDAYQVLLGIAKITKEEQWNRVAPELVESDYPFPRFDGTLGTLVLTKPSDRNPERLFAVTLGGALDFNSIELTRLFRYDQKIKTSREIFDTTLVAVWIQQQILRDLSDEWSLSPIKVVKVDKHGADFTYSQSFALLRIESDSDFFESEENLLRHEF
jgi:hypothetical protein